MKKTQIKLIGTLLIIGSFITSTYAASIDASIKSVSVTDQKTLSVSLANSVEGAEFTGDAKVLKDLSVKSATKNPQNAKIVNVILGNDLLPDNSYSLLSIFGAEGNMDFSLKSTLTNVEFLNPELDGSIEKIVVKDAKNMDVYYKMDIKSEEIEYKILSNLGVETIKRDSVNASNMIFTLKTPLEQSTGYILMLVSLKNTKGDEINFSEGIYDFNSGTFSVASMVSNTGSVASGSVSPQDTLVDLNSAAVINETTTLDEMQDKLIEEVAATAPATPDTGAETWVLILGTLIINTVLFYTRRKKSQIA